MRRFEAGCKLPPAVERRAAVGFARIAHETVKAMGSHGAILGADIRI